MKTKVKGLLIVNENTLAAATIKELEKGRKHKLAAIQKMAGSLYPRILGAEVAKIEAELIRRRLKRHAPVLLDVCKTMQTRLLESRCVNCGQGKPVLGWVEMYDELTKAILKIDPDWEIK